MAQTVLPIDAASPAYSVDIALSGQLYRFTVAYNTRGSYWGIGIYMPDDTPIIEGCRITADWPLFYQYPDERLPIGRLFAVDLSGQSLDPTEDDLGTRVLVVYDDGA